ncbi:MAG: transketolase family protein [Promethearchaeota archaeon]
MKSTRDAFGEFLVERGAVDGNLVVLDADLSASTRTEWFGEKFPRRFFNLGIAEQNLVGVGMGMALAGKNVVVSGFTVFTLGKAWDLLRAAAYDKIPIKVCTTHSGLSPGRDGATHQCLEDLALTSAIPGLNVVVPADARETMACMEFALDTREPFFVRLGRNPAPEVFDGEYEFKMGEMPEVADGDDVAIFAVGGCVHPAKEAATELGKQGISARVLDASTVKPLNRDLIVANAKRTGLVLTVEDHNYLNGFGAQVCRILAEEYPVPVKVMGVRDEFGQSGSESELLAHYGLSANHIARNVKDLLRKR